MTLPTQLRIGIDIGGTFTDFVVLDISTRQLTTFKIPSTPQNPADAVLQGLTRLTEIFAPSTRSPLPWDIVHGSTVATNALLERKGAKTALVATAGFRQILQIGRQNRPELYNLTVAPRDPLIPDSASFEIGGRIDSQGNPIEPLDVKAIPALADRLQQAGIESVAISFLFSFANSLHEHTLAHYLESQGFLVSTSHKILPEYREYERTSTTAINAYVFPVFEKYLSKLTGAVSLQTPMRIMQSNGGSIQADLARRQAVRCIISGPAGGIIAAQSINTLVHSTTSSRPLLTFDMGGTSTDVSALDGPLRLTREAYVDGYPIAIPLLDIHTIGAGGGSIAYVDSGGALRVGPHSAGADPGPACYGVGTQPTVTDANMLLGRLLRDRPLSGDLQLDYDRAAAVFDTLGAATYLDPISAALGVIEIANSHMERALRLITVERGKDPHDYTLFSFGGAGGLHACSLARRLSIPSVLISPLASTLSAYGMLVSDLVKDYSTTVMLPAARQSELPAYFDALIASAEADFALQGYSASELQLERTLLLRYRGQSYELDIPYTLTALAQFHTVYKQEYGYALPDQPVEIVHIRLRATVILPKPDLPQFETSLSDPSQALLGHTSVVFPGNSSTQPVTRLVPYYQGESLLSGNQLHGPALVVRDDTTILLEPGDAATVDSFGNLLIQITPEHL